MDEFKAGDLVIVVVTLRVRRGASVPSVPSCKAVVFRW